MSDPYRTYGQHHAVAIGYDASKPDVDAFLAHMEAHLPAHGVEAYMDGFYDASLGGKRRAFTYLRPLMKEGSDA